jgi:hypothetical protein
MPVRGLAAVRLLPPLLAAALFAGCATLPEAGRSATKSASESAAAVPAATPAVGGSTAPASRPRVRPVVRPAARPPAARRPLPPSSGTPGRSRGADALAEGRQGLDRAAAISLGRAFLLSPKIRSGIGEGWLLGGLMAFRSTAPAGRRWCSSSACTTRFGWWRATPTSSPAPATPEARAVEASYSASLLGSTAVASAPHPESKSVLVEANPLFLSDLQGLGMRLQAAFRQGYGLDSRNSVITAVRATPQAVVIETQQHFYAGSVGAAPPGAPPGTPAPGRPNFLPDTRSLLIGMHYSLAPLAETPMPARRADPRLGLFTTTVLDFGEDLARTPRTRLVHRWRLEKKDPAAACPSR